jgi:hypothetical protein
LKVKGSDQREREKTVYTNSPVNADGVHHDNKVPSFEHSAAAQVANAPEVPRIISALVG